MRPCPWTAAAWLAILVGGVSAPAVAGKFNEALSVGDAAPDFAGLVGIDDRPHALADYGDARLLVMVFTGNRCPVARAYEPRLVALAQEYGPRGVQVVAVNVGTDEADGLPRMKERAAEAGFNFPYLHDPGQDSGRRYGVTVTPQVFVLDRERRIAYMGRIDDHTDAQRVRRAYLRQALDALLAGDRPKVAETLAVGCEIKYP